MVIENFFLKFIITTKSLCVIDPNKISREHVSPHLQDPPQFSLGSRRRHVSDQLPTRSPRRTLHHFRSPQHRRPYRQCGLSARWRVGVAVARQPEEDADQRHVVVAFNWFGADCRRFRVGGSFHQLFLLNLTFFYLT